MLAVYRRTGDGFGDLELIEAYARSRPCSLLTSLHDLAPCEANRCQIAVFNPASNENQFSRLRLINPSTEIASVTITGTDDAGQSPGDLVRLDLPAGAPVP